MDYYKSSKDAYSLLVAFAVIIGFAWMITAGLVFWQPKAYLLAGIATAIVFVCVFPTILQRIKGDEPCDLYKKVVGSKTDGWSAAGCKATPGYQFKHKYDSYDFFWKSSYCCFMLFAYQLACAAAIVYEEMEECEKKKEEAKEEKKVQPQVPVQAVVKPPEKIEPEIVKVQPADIKPSETKQETVPVASPMTAPKLPTEDKKEFFKEPAKEPVKEPVIEPAKEMVKEVPGSKARPIIPAVMFVPEAVKEGKVAEEGFKMEQVIPPAKEEEKVKVPEAAIVEIGKPEKADVIEMPEQKEGEMKQISEESLDIIMLQPPAEDSPVPQMGPQSKVFTVPPKI